MKVLVVEDEDPKLGPILLFLKEKYPNCSVTTARSVRAAIEEIRKDVPNLLLLDMSLPTFNVVPGEAGGRPQGFGGIEVLRNLQMQDLTVPVIVVTGYEAFSRNDGKKIDLGGLAQELTEDFPSTFRGIVQFNPMFGRWSDELLELIDHCMQKGR